MKMRLFFLPVVATVFSCLLTSPVRADKVADGSVNFTGILLGKETCTLVNPDLNVDFGMLTAGPGATPVILTSRNVAFHFVKCPATTGSVVMTVSFEEVSGSFSAAPYGIGNKGTSDVMGVLNCDAGEVTQAGVSGCPADPAVLRNFSRLTGKVGNDRTLSFPLTVSLASRWEGLDGTPSVSPGTVNMTVNFTFEEM